MNSPRSNLREVLEQRAGGVLDHANHERVAEVHRRVRRARRRRSAMVSAAAAVVLVAVGLAVALPRNHEPQPVDAPAKMVGHTVPKTTKSYGATYTYTRGYTSSDGHLEVTLPTDPRDVLLRAASASRTGQLVVHSRGAQPWVVPAGGFGEFTSPEGTSRQVSLDLRGARPAPVALAVYTLAEHAPGYTRGGVTYPDSVARQPLLGAFIGALGQDSGTIRIPALHGTDHRRLTVAAFCSGVPKGAMVEISAGDGPVSIGCHGPAPSDAGHGSSQFSTRFPAHAFRTTVRLTDAHGHPIPVPPGGRLGAGVYGVPPGPGAEGLPGWYDLDGHTWRLVGALGWTRATGSWRSVPVHAGRPVLVGYGTSDRIEGAVIHARIPGSGPVANMGGGHGFTIVSNGDPRARVQLRADRLPAGVPLVVGTYRLADGEH